MADNFNFTEGSGRTGAADDIGGVLYPRQKLIHGVDGTNDGDVSKGNGYPVGPARSGYEALVEIAYSSITGSFASAALTNLGTSRVMAVHNETDGNVYGSFDAGTTKHLWFPARSSREVPVKDGATQLHIKHDGVAPTVGNFRVEVRS